MYRKYSAQGRTRRNCSTHCSCAALPLQQGLEAQPWGHTATVPARPQIWFSACCSTVVPGTHPGQLHRVTDGIGPEWPQPLYSKDTFCQPPSKLWAVFCDLLFTLSGNLGRREHQMPPTTSLQLLIGATIWIPQYCLGPSGSNSCRGTACQAWIRAEGSEGRIEPRTVMLGSQRLAALIIYSSIVRSKSKWNKKIHSTLEAAGLLGGGFSAPWQA